MAGPVPLPMIQVKKILLPPFNKENIPDEKQQPDDE
jgi:hypothetical protein